ncbi:MAG: translation initiation factor IF-5A [Candidatus Micrarchaeota archaeon]|nr:translation initiation factor IF-5A [Candidatus Micrarchaeota archaeon]MDE1804828.1 translation initiation factor IF-5A [Candidatus Micrarchaeota archaeon]MDE1847149.1 translation initiation factor IF-5A [Candidatus Micrarchaeota archaeon]
MADEIMFVSVGDLKPGRFLMIDGVPCRVVNMETSAPGKHGAASVRITAIGMFDNKKRTLLKGSRSEVEAPVITKRKAQVVSVSGTMAQLMDLESYDTYELPIPEDLVSQMKSGAEVEIIDTQGQKAITRMISGG